MDFILIFFLYLSLWNNQLVGGLVLPQSVPSAPEPLDTPASKTGRSAALSSPRRDTGRKIGKWNYHGPVSFRECYTRERRARRNLWFFWLKKALMMRSSTQPLLSQSAAQGCRMRSYLQGRAWMLTLQRVKGQPWPPLPLHLQLPWPSSFGVELLCTSCRLCPGRVTFDRYVGWLSFGIFSLVLFSWMI